MNDTLKGLSILSITVVAIAWVLQSDNSGWEIPFLAFKGQNSSDVAQLQREILAGADPTLIQQPTAAGQQSNACYKGWVSLSGVEPAIIQQSYQGIQSGGRVYLRILEQDILLDVSLADQAKAHRPDAVPVSVALQLADMHTIKEGCNQKDFVVSLAD